MARYRRRNTTRRRYGYRRGRYPRAGLDPLFWVALAVAVLIVLYALTR